MINYGLRLCLTVAPLFTLLLLWELATDYAWIDYRFYPAPSAIIIYTFSTATDHLFDDISASLRRIAIGYIVGVLLGIMFGLLMGLNRIVRMGLYPLIAVTYPIPKIAILPLIMLVFGIDEAPKIVVVIIGSFFLVLLNTLHGVDSMGRIYHDVARVNKIRLFDYVSRIIFPGALPSIFTGLKLAIGYSLVIVVAAEFSGANAGIGYMIWQSWEAFEIKAVYSGIFVIGVIGFVFMFVLEWLERVCIPWQTGKQGIYQLPV